MKKKPPVLRFPKPKAVAQPDDRHWHNGGDIEIGLYARSLHKAAKSPHRNPGPGTEPQGSVGCVPGHPALQAVR